MASFNSFYVAVVFIISFNLLIENLVASENSEACKTPSSRVNHAPAPTPLSPYGAYLSNCVNKLKPKCGEQILFSVIVGNQTVSRYCCTSLVKDMGQTCHTDVTRYATDLPEHKNNKREILNRCDKVWKHCSCLVSHHSSKFDSV